MSATSSDLLKATPSLRPGDELWSARGEVRVYALAKPYLEPFAQAHAIWEAAQMDGVFVKTGDVAALSHRFGKGRVYWQWRSSHPNYPKVLVLFIAGVKWAAGVTNGGIWLGLDLHDPTLEPTTSRRAGVLIVGVVRESPADQAGLRQGDRIVAVNDLNVTTLEDFAKLITLAKVGDRLRMQVARNGSSLTVELVIGDAGKRGVVARF